MPIIRNKIVLILLTLNAGASFCRVIDGIKSQDLMPDVVSVFDSESTDGTEAIAIKAGFIVNVLSKSDFNHGATRQLALTLYPDADIIIYMTQDAILAVPNAIKNIIAPFEDEKIAAVCGRQLPHKGSSPIATHARLFNYSSISSLKSQEDVPRIGIKAAFLSNSFAAYRRAALEEVGGFPSNVIFGEDTFVAAKMLQAGWKIAYAADATCYHSHNYSLKEEFERYFDIGVFHSREKWFIKSLGKAEGEGKRFVFSELKYLVENAPYFIPSAAIRTVLKFVGYRLGQLESKVPLWLKLKLSMNKGYWK